MTNCRFPVAGTELTIPWEVAVKTYQVWVRQQAKKMPISMNLITGLMTMRQLFRHGVTSDELDTWYGEHWREMAE